MNESGEKKQYLYVRVLKTELKKRQRSNPAYSMRALARDLNVSNSVLSRLFSRKNVPTFEVTLRIAKKLQMDASQTRRLVNSVTLAMRDRVLDRELN